MAVTAADYWKGLTSNSIQRQIKYFVHSEISKWSNCIPDSGVMQLTVETPVKGSLVQRGNITLDIFL